MVIPLCHLTFNFTYNSLGGPELPFEKMKLFELPGVTQFKIRPALIGLQQISHYKALFDPGRKNVIHELMDITRGMGSKTCQNMISILKYSLLQTFKMPQIVTLSCANKIKIRASGKLSCLNFDLLLPFRQKWHFLPITWATFFKWN